MNDRSERDDLVLAELRIMREHIGALVSELRKRKRKSTKRTRTLAKKHLDEVETDTDKPTELEIARARRYLKR